MLLPLPRPHGILVHGGVGLSRGVVARRQAVAGLTAIVTVPVVHGAVLVVQSYKDRSHKAVCYKHEVRAADFCLHKLLDPLKRSSLLRSAHPERIKTQTTESL